MADENDEWMGELETMEREDSFPEQSPRCTPRRRVMWAAAILLVLMVLLVVVAAVVVPVSVVMTSSSPSPSHSHHSPEGHDIYTYSLTEGPMWSNENTRRALLKVTPGQWEQTMSVSGEYNLPMWPTRQGLFLALPVRTGDLQVRYLADGSFKQSLDIWPELPYSSFQSCLLWTPPGDTDHDEGVVVALKGQYRKFNVTEEHGVQWDSPILALDLPKSDVVEGVWANDDFTELYFSMGSYLLLGVDALTSTTMWTRDDLVLPLLPHAIVLGKRLVAIVKVQHDFSVMALSTINGETLWDAPLTRDRSPSYGMAASPDNRRVFVIFKDRPTGSCKDADIEQILFALDVDTGKELWRVELEGAECPPAYSSYAWPSVHVLAEPQAYPQFDYILITKITHTLSAFSPKGEKLWSVRSDPYDDEEITVHTILSDGTILLYDGSQYSETGELMTPLVLRGIHFCGFVDENNNVFTFTRHDDGSGSVYFN